MSQQVEAKPDHGRYIEKDIKIIYLFFYDANLSVGTFIE